MAGQRLGPYRLERLLGQGGMGQVWLAHADPAGGRPARKVAVKLLPAELAVDPAYRSRFEREAELAARLHDRHLVSIHAHGELDGRLFIEMEYVEGEDLSHLLHRGPLPPERAVDIVTQTAAALDAAHRAGLVHRDVKPSNIVIRRDGVVYLIDFGIAYGAGTTALTASGLAVGTLAYMAPERFTGETDARADIYSLGCVLFECLAGMRPFGDTDPARQMHDHLTTAPPSVRTLVPDVPDRLDAVIARALAKDPGDRFASAGEFARAAASALGRPGPPIASAPAEHPGIHRYELDANPADARGSEPPVSAPDETGSPSTRRYEAPAPADTRYDEPGSNPSTRRYEHPAPAGTHHEEAGSAPSTRRYEPGVGPAGTRRYEAAAPPPGTRAYTDSAAGPTHDPATRPPGTRAYTGPAAAGTAYGAAAPPSGTRAYTDSAAGPTHGAAGAGHPPTRAYTAPATGHTAGGTPPGGDMAHAGVRPVAPDRPAPRTPAPARRPARARPAARPRRRKSRLRRLVLWLIVLVVIPLALIGGCMAALVQGAGSIEFFSGDDRSTAAAGTAVRDGSFEFMVRNVESDVPTVGFDRAQGMFVVVSFTVLNIAAEPKTYTPLGQELHDSAGTKFGPDVTATAQRAATAAAPRTLQPGESLGTHLVYELPATAVPATMTFRDFPFSLGTSVALG